MTELDKAYIEHIESDDELAGTHIDRPIIFQRKKTAAQQSIEALIIQARIDEQKRSKPKMQADNENGVRLYITVDVDEGGWDSQEIRIQELQKELEANE